MPSYVKKPPRTQQEIQEINDAAWRSDAAGIPQAAEPIKVETEEFVSIAGLASKGRDELIERLRQHQAKKDAVAEYVPPKPSARQLSQTQLEIEAGRRTQKANEARMAARPTPSREASDGYTTPVYRPGDSVPGFDSKDPGAQTLK